MLNLYGIGEATIWIINYKMKLVKMMGIKRPVRMAEWEDAKEIVKESMRKNKKFYDRLAKM